jgi:hypothetical protein
MTREILYQTWRMASENPEGKGVVEQLLLVRYHGVRLAHQRHIRIGHPPFVAKSMQSSRFLTRVSRAISLSACRTKVSFLMIITDNSLAAHKLPVLAHPHAHTSLPWFPSATMRCLPARGG